MAVQEVDFLKRYIHYCRSQCSPRLGEGAHERLTAYYVEIREEVRGASYPLCRASNLWGVRDTATNVELL